MTGLMEYVDYSIGNEEDAEKVFGIKAGTSDVSKGELSHEGYKDVAKQLADKFSLKGVAITLRESFPLSTMDGLLFTTTEISFISLSDQIHIVDRVGGGFFAGGLIYAICNGYSKQDAVEFAGCFLSKAQHSR